MLKVKNNISISLRINREAIEELFESGLAIEFFKICDKEIRFISSQFREMLRGIKGSAALAMVINIS